LPVLAMLTGLVAGILLANVGWWGMTLSCGIFLVGAGWVVLGREGRFGWLIGLVLAAVGVGAGRYEIVHEWVGEDHISRFVSADGELARIRGVVHGPVEHARRSKSPFAPWVMRGTHSQFLLEAQQIELQSGWSPCEGLIRVSAKERLGPLTPGQSVMIYGKLYGWGPVSNPGGFNWGAYQRAQGVWAGLSIDHAAAVVVDPTDGQIRPWRDRLRHWTQCMLLEGIPAEYPGRSALLKTMVLGRRSAVSDDINEAFQRTGTAHFLAVSGLHVGIVGIVIFLLTRLLSLSEGWGAALAVVVILLYVVIADARAPILRAGVMAGLLSIAIVARRPIRRSYWLPMSAIVLLLIRPHWLYEIGFQLSFAVTAGVIYLSPRLAEACSRHVLRKNPEIEALEDRPQAIDEVEGVWNQIRFGGNWLLGKIGAFFMIAVSAWLVGGPIAWFYFGQFAPLGWLFSALLFPLVFLVMTLAVARVLVGLALPSLGLVLAKPVAGATGWLITAAGTMAEWPGAGVDWTRPAGWWLGLYLTALASWSWRLGGRQVHLAMAGVVLIGGVIHWWPANRLRDDLRIHVLAVGDGSATLIELPNGKHWIYDAGTLGSFDVGDIVLVPAAEALNIRQFDGAIVSHPNLDHFSGIPTVWEHRRVDRLITNSHFKDNVLSGSATSHFLKLAHQSGLKPHELNRGDSVDGWGSVGVEILWPPRNVAEPLSANDSSTVLRLSHAGQSVLLCGDIEEFALRALLESDDLRADVLFLPHHGGYEKSTAAFIAAVDPETVIRSSSKRRNASRSELFEAIGARRYLCTADDGAVTIRLSAEGVDVRGFLPAKGAASPSE
jgi:competence protein ComEC